MGELVGIRQTSKTGKLTAIPPRRVSNASVRSREYLTPAEVDSMIDAARSTGRYGHRDATLILLAYRHALRVSELVSLRRDQGRPSSREPPRQPVEEWNAERSPFTRAGDSSLAETFQGLP